MKVKIIVDDSLKYHGIANAFISTLLRQMNEKEGILIHRTYQDGPVSIRLLPFYESAEDVLKIIRISTPVDAEFSLGDMTPQERRRWIYGD